MIKIPGKACALKTFSTMRQSRPAFVLGLVAWLGASAYFAFRFAAAEQSGDPWWRELLTMLVSLQILSGSIAPTASEVRTELTSGRLPTVMLLSGTLWKAFNESGVVRSIYVWLRSVATFLIIGAISGFPSWPQLAFGLTLLLVSVIGLQAFANILASLTIVLGRHATIGIAIGQLVVIAMVVLSSKPSVLLPFGLGRVLVRTMVQGGDLPAGGAIQTLANAFLYLIASYVVITWIEWRALTMGKFFDHD